MFSDKIVDNVKDEIDMSGEQKGETYNDIDNKIVTFM